MNIISLQDLQQKFDILVSHVGFQTDNNKLLIFTNELLIQVLSELRRINQRIDEVDAK